ncbi:acyl-CoA thioesterase [Sedimentisphaera salicampi]|uniref:Tol-pal system-associated acyl-CoA thioesterase n=1 Tax=Sedimentisphaera salicampi TaxID=1941349 RepID=A0A1W6LJU3_9BACT|nr:thioesterase family protein [Sedimentisphaera salicampi]ARN56047.1 tol-pal system-associated acyl-CoA thioesterase [Sedimentisphaera salicampi]OXU15780.1 tol-pal system-associated acyl-CoA thioesterase [Sedimentisphaera salicampi]
MFSKVVTPRFGDIDGLRHINNCVIPQWFEQARNPLFEIFVPDLSLDPSNWNMIMAHIDFDFLGQMYFGTDVQIRTYISKIGNSSFHLYQQALQNDKLCVEGNAVIVHYDFSLQKAVRIPDDIREELKKHLYSDHS